MTLLKQWTSFALNCLALKGSSPSAPPPAHRAALMATKSYSPRVGDGFSYSGQVSPLEKLSLLRATTERLVSRRLNAFLPAAFQFNLMSHCRVVRRRRAFSMCGEMSRLHALSCAATAGQIRSTFPSAFNLFAVQCGQPICRIIQGESNCTDSRANHRICVWNLG